MKAGTGKGTSAKHAGGHKHVHGHGKHHPAKKKTATHHHHVQHHHQVHTVAKGHKVAKPKQQHHGKARGLALAGVACCAAEALAASLRLAGWPVGEEDVLALHEAAGGTADTGVSIQAALAAAAAHGLAGVRPRRFGPAAAAGDGAVVGVQLPPGWYSADGGAHTLTAEAGGVWSWGQWHPWECFPAEVEEIWEVTWP